MGGGSPAARRMARSVRSGGAALAGLANASTGQPPTGGRLDIRSLAGQPTETAINAIVDSFLPAGILDEMTARLAMEEALALALGGPDTFDPSAIGVNTVRIATLAFVTELVFVQIAGDAGRSLAAVGPVAAAQREADIRSLIREVVDLVGTPLLSKDGGVITEQRMSSLVSQVLREALEEIGTW